jgi:hypothetical protein
MNEEQRKNNNKSITITNNIIIIIIIILRGSTVLERTLAALHWRFRNVFRHTVGLLWARGQPVAKASTYTGQHKTEK